MKRFILIILDGFGIGYMKDTHLVRPQDVGANTCLNILKSTPGLKLDNLEKLGLMNALGIDFGDMKKNNDAAYGISDLAHSGADTFYGHQEMMGTNPKEPICEPFSMSIDKVYQVLKEAGYHVQFKGKNQRFLLVNGCVTVADNIEADPGSAYNVTSALDLIDFKEVINIGKLIRRAVKVSRVIVFGGKGVTVDDILSAVEEKDGNYIGINAPKSGVYNKGYQVAHFGFGVNPEVQVPTILGRAGIKVTLIGKVADIVENAFGKSIPGVDTEEIMRSSLKEILSEDTGFTAVNVQETDLAGHSQDVLKYVDKLLIADKYIGKIIDHLDEEDILVVTADHGNDPTIGHSHHTRENVPVLVYGRNINKGCIGHRTTLSDIGMTVTEYFKCDPCENGVSFL